MRGSPPQVGLRLLTVVGARPQFIKAATVSRAIREHNIAHPERSVREVLLHTGQHYDENMSQVFFDELEIPQPDYNLGVGSLSHGAQTGRMLEHTEEVLLKEKPDWVLVYGDTNSTLAGALAAAKLHIPVAHVEAGLRSFNHRMPEEINRVLTDHLSTLLFCPTQTAVDNLAREGVLKGVELVGDVMYDAALYYAAKAEAHSSIMDRLGLCSKGYMLATLHRAENTDDPFRLRAIVEGLGAVAQHMPVVIPLHPRTRAALEREGLLARVTETCQLIQPLGYLDMVLLEKNARLIATDSGGVQKEAYFYGVPCMTLREETEWVETVEAGWNVLVGADSERIASVALSFATPPARPALYGDGSAAKRCVAILANVIDENSRHKPSG